MRLAAVLTTGAIMAMLVAVVILRQDGAAHRQSANLQFLASLFNQVVSALESDRRQKMIAVRHIGMILFRAANAHEDFAFIVVGRNVFISDGPISADAIVGIALKI